MTESRQPNILHSRRPLSVCIASVFALAAPAGALAASVTSCLDDGGPGTLRSIIAAAAESETVDLSGLTGPSACLNSTISLASTISITQNALTIEGGATNLIIDASGIAPYIGAYGDFRVFQHSGTGTLTVNHLELKGGYVHHTSQAYGTFGGCISSSGNVTLSGSTVTGCLVRNTGSYNPADGGGVWTSGNLTLNNSTVDFNSAVAPSTSARGGGVFVSGTLTLDDSVIAHNETTSASGQALGGGAYSRSTISSNGSDVQYNTATTTTLGFSRGAGLYAYADLNLDFSTVSMNSAVSTKGADGGAAHVRGALSASYCTVSNNDVQGPSSYTRGGAFYLTGNSTFNKCTISNNSSLGSFGGIDAFSETPSDKLFQMTNSTVTGNSSANTSGGLYVNSATVNLRNSTIAFNGAGVKHPGVLFGTAFGPMDVTMKSNLMVYNKVGSGESDLFIITSENALTFNGGNLAAQARNLIGATTVDTADLPDDTLFGVCPRLGPLRDNGGLTLTHALYSGSPAIDVGDDSLGALYDQRGKASVNGDIDYTRFSGLSAIADIGAYEVQQNEIVFNANFEGCPFL